MVNANFLTEDSYLGNIYEPLTLNRYNYCVSNPVNYRDPSGNVPVETIADVAFLVWDVVELYNEPSWVNGGFLVWDIVATALPYIPGSYVVKGIDKIKDVLTFTKKVDNAQDISETVKLVDDVPELVDKALDTAEAGSKGSSIESKGAKECLEEAEEEAIENSAKKATCGASNAIESGSSSIVEIVDKEKGTFIIKDWSNYPDDYVPVPDKNKVWTFLEGDEYNSARDSANTVNRNMRSADSYYADNGLEIHEIEPVKMGGSPTDVNNKQSQVHRRYVTP